MSKRERSGALLNVLILLVILSAIVAWHEGLIETALRAFEGT